jgi:hypothetical protein
MPDNGLLNDIELTVDDVGQLEDAQQLAHFFHTLGYEVGDGGATKLTHEALQLDAEDLRFEIQAIWQVATDPVDEDIKIYLMEVRSVTIKLTQLIARRFRERPGNFLLVLTTDYEELHFILLDVVLAKSKQRGKPFTRILRPRILKVDRHKVTRDSVELRVLKRFTFTEIDAVAQLDKLRSAYMLAEWSEQYFNNRALFSDHYLTYRLTDPRITPEWDEDATAILRDVNNQISQARRRFTGQPEAQVRADLFEPLFELLGFEFEVVKDGASDASEPDYRLYEGGQHDKPIALALTYVWNRNLDDMDNQRDSETPDEIPGALVVSILEATDVPWVIVTNGKLWRLYSSTASNKATNYYEVDLEEAPNATERITALKYWWLLFRRQAFTGFLDALLQNSEDYAKGLRERLKDSIFESIFPQFAEGFIANIKAQGVAQADVDAMLPTIFSGTMTFLYRMMFILYAESLELLPVNEDGGYREKSLYTLKNEIAVVGGDAESVAPDNLKKKYSPSALTLYERLTELFHVIDKGSADLNMPTYNGGLFSTETDSGAFLETYGIPDRFLACGLDRLARDEDDKTKQLVMVDFKSLGVRQLGSVYEGLLEFKLKRAQAELAVIKDSGKEVYLPAKEAGTKRVLATVKKGEIYLDNDKSERKATGSYYTPDYIVKYIVEHTVGPVLERKFAELRPKLYEAQRDYRNYAKLVEARKQSTGKDEAADVFWQSDKMQQLVDECLNVRVLDPAMGSGHFLVDVVDFVSNRLIDFLNAWSENPVWAKLEETKQDIIDDLTRQGVSVNFDRLNRVALLKRAVLKRVVYGVDLNDMAVELAKVSLWLNAFTLGAPLSFLDHHLKHGNSLIGVRVKEVQKALEGDGQLSMFSGSKFAGVMLATDLMQQVSYLSDNTIAQAEASKKAYSSARDHLAPYKRVLDVYTSRWFGNTPSTSRKQTFDPTIEFLKRDDTQAWLEDPHNPKNRLPADDYMQAGLVAKTALNAAADKHFFHWELEFPEVFFAPSQRGGQDVQLRDDGGFDAVVGNPPYGVGFDDEKGFFSATSIYQRGKPESYVFFTEQGIKILAKNGFVGLITPNAWLTNYYGIQLREWVLNNGTVRYVVNLEPIGVFDEAIVDTTVVILEKETTSQVREIAVVEPDENGNFREKFYSNQAVWIEDSEHLFNIMASEVDLATIGKIEHYSLRMSDIGEYSQGIIPYTTR